jgi:hypothetical protein
MITLSLMGTKQTGRKTSRTVEFNELFEPMLLLQAASGLSFADVARLLIREGMKSDLVKTYLMNKSKDETKESRAAPRQK